jgi:hypothetical protein
MAIAHSLPAVHGERATYKGLYFRRLPVISA